MEGKNGGGKERRRERTAEGKNGKGQDRNPRKQMNRKHFCVMIKGIITDEGYTKAVDTM